MLQVLDKICIHIIPNLAFQEYSSAFPHKERTVRYAGRPSGPTCDVSIEDNAHDRGPGWQHDHDLYEADSCFGTVAKGYVEHVFAHQEGGGLGIPRGCEETCFDQDHDYPCGIQDGPSGQGASREQL